MKAAQHAANRQANWEQDVRIRIRPGRADSGVKLYVTDHNAGGPQEYMANTGFLRYPKLFAALASLIAEFPVGKDVRALIVPLSVGIEAVSLVVAGRKTNAFAGRAVTVEGFDISQKATELARAGVFPRLFFPDDIAPFADTLAEIDGGFVEVVPDAMAAINVLDAGDVLTFEPDQPYDMVICLNLLMHLPEAARPKLVGRLAALTAPGGILCLNNNQEWPYELIPYFEELTSPAGGFVSLLPCLEHGPAPERSSEPAPEFAVTDANAMILRRKAA